MTNDINFWTGIKEPHLKPDKPFLTEEVLCPVKLTL